MRRRWAAALLGLAAAWLIGGSLAGAPVERIRLRGSDTMLRLVQLWAEGFMQANPGVAVEVEGGGSAVGFQALIRGDVEIAAASRPLSSGEAQQLLERQGGLGYAVLTARDALSIYLHPDNPVTDLDLDELTQIFTGETRFWNQVGGTAGRVQVLTRNRASGTQQFFLEHVLGGQPFTRPARVLPTTTDIVEAVREDPGAIGYGGVGYASGVRACDVEGIAPSPANVREGSYPIARYLYLYTASPPRGSVKAFIDWVLGSEGQRLVVEAGYVALYGPDERSTGDAAER